MNKCWSYYHFYFSSHLWLHYRETPNTLLQSPHPPTTHSTPLLCFLILGLQHWALLRPPPHSSQRCLRATTLGSASPALCNFMLGQPASEQQQKRKKDHLTPCTSKRCKKIHIFSFYQFILFFCSKFWETRLFPFTKILHSLCLTPFPTFFFLLNSEIKVTAPKPLWK